MKQEIIDLINSCDDESKIYLILRFIKRYLNVENQQQQINQ